MSKAEEVAIKRYPKVGLYDNMMKREGFIEGYNQAVKDLELTWEEIYSLLYLEREVIREWGGKEYSNEGLCKEVLKRYKERKRNE